MKGLDVEISLYAFEETVDTTGVERYSVLIDNGRANICIARCDSYDLATEVIQCFMTACAALGYDLESVD